MSVRIHRNSYETMLLHRRHCHTAVSRKPIRELREPDEVIFMQIYFKTAMPSPLSWPVAHQLCPDCMRMRFPFSELGHFRFFCVCKNLVFESFITKLK